MSTLHLVVMVTEHVLFGAIDRSTLFVLFSCELMGSDILLFCFRVKRFTFCVVQAFVYIVIVAKIEPWEHFLYYNIVDLKLYPCENTCYEYTRSQIVNR